MLAVSIGLAAAAGLPACSDAEGDGSPRGAPAGASVERGAGATNGSARVRVDGRGVTLQARSAPRRDLLEKLARELDFELVAPDVGNEPITAEADGLPLEAVVPRLLPDRSYRLDFALDVAAGAHRVSRLEVAALGERSRPPGSSLATGADRPAPQVVRSKPGRTPRGSNGVDWKELLLRLDDADHEERIDALREIDPNGEGLPLITDRLARDPNPEVRIAAAEVLEEGETLSAVDALVFALDDPDPEVVLAAIAALELTDDVTVVNDLALLLDHPNGAIREAAFDAIEYIQWDE